ncbi:MAG: hypothetical protein FWC06_04495 [Treponema sp.]|nr:hypothetical protein [Treponema sp.]
MRNFAKLILFFSLTFVIIFVSVTAVRFLSLRIDWAKSLPVKPETTLTLLITAAHWAMSLSLFSSIVIAVNYAARREYFSVMTIGCIMVLSVLYCFGISFALEQWKSVPPSQSNGVPLGGRGLILTNTLSKNETAVVLLNGTADPLGPRVVAIPGQRLVYQQSASVNYNLPPVLFGNDTPWFMESLAIDIRLNAEMFRKKFLEGIFPFLIYAGSLIFMLCSLAYVLKFSVWPLANLFLAALVFCGVLSLNSFLNTPEMQEITGSFLNNIIPVSFALPLFFVGLGILLNLYSLLSFAAKKRYNDED